MSAYHTPGTVSSTRHVLIHVITSPSHTYSLEVDAVIVSILLMSKWREAEEAVQDFTERR